jgi:hypothetical protein
MAALPDRVGAQGGLRRASRRHGRARVAGSAGRIGGVITHVVLMTFADRADAPEVKRRLEALAAAIGAVRSLRVDLDSLGLDGSAHLWLTTTHDSADGLREYQRHPAHTEFLGWLKPRLVARAAVDVESPGEVRVPGVRVESPG